MEGGSTRVVMPTDIVPTALAEQADILVRATHLTKVYRLYRKPSYRFLDMFGLLGNRPHAYSEHAAVDDVSLAIRRGEKVAIIGRNGAGKSTLLKLVTGVVEPTRGTLDVKGNVHALLQIGTGFHPDFTGRENVYAYLAQLGVTGEEARRRCADVIEFAELEEYIDQPIKTYSTGMSVRLMFSASTAITPDLLVLDEVLGVGDAYFSQKSFERMRELAEHNGTTLLLVTHDVYSAAQLCNRIVWIDRGRVLMDGDGPTIIKSYEDSIRRQEEHRLRLKKQAKLRELTAGAATATAARHVILEIASRFGRAQPGPVFLSDVRLLANGRPIAMLPLDEQAFDGSGSHLDATASSWGEPTEIDGRLCRPMLNYGTAFHKVGGVFGVMDGEVDVVNTQLGCSLAYEAPDGCDLLVRLFVDRREIALGAISDRSSVWTTWTSSGGEERIDAADTVSTSGVHGTATFVVNDARFIDERGEEVHILQHGRPAALDIDYTIADPALRERAQVVVAIHRDAVLTVARFITRDLFFDAGTKRSGTIRLGMPRVTLTDGDYAVTIMIAKEGYYDTSQTVFFTVNPGVYCCMSRLLEVSVVGAGLIGSGSPHVLEGLWCLK
jgi:ABC-type polysaccharide/polyol phosphate transport system ATPase subunit